MSEGGAGGFVWRDAGRTVRFGAGVLADAERLLAEHGVAEFALLSTERALAGSPGLAAAAGSVHLVAPGQVPDTAAALLAEVGAPSLVALGGGRVVDTAKAIAAVTGADVAALPTTLSGAEMTAIHRLPAGAEERVRAMVRPSLVLADAEAMTALPEAQLRATAMNALAHGIDSLGTPLANPVAEMAALRGVAEIAAALDQAPERRDRGALARGSLLCGYAIDSAGFGVHHVVCQTLVRVCGGPHAETNAAILPGSAALLATRLPESTDLAGALGRKPDAVATRIRELGRPRPLADLGADRAQLDRALEAILERPELQNTPGPSITRGELERLVLSAW